MICVPISLLQIGSGINDYGKHGGVNAWFYLIFEAGCVLITLNVLHNPWRSLNYYQVVNYDQVDK